MIMGEIKPYAEGQKPSKCGHFYPDVLRVKDFKKSGKVYRLLNCVHCGDYPVEIDHHTYNPDVANREEFPAYRKREIARLKGENP